MDLEVCKELDQLQGPTQTFPLIKRSFDWPQQLAKENPIWCLFKDETASLFLWFQTSHHYCITQNPWKVCSYSALLGVKIAFPWDQLCLLANSHHSWACWQLTFLHRRKAGEPLASHPRFQLLSQPFSCNSALIAGGLKVWEGDREYWVGKVTGSSFQPEPRGS